MSVIKNMKLSVIAAAVGAAAAELILEGRKGRGPLKQLKSAEMKSLPGNDPQFRPGLVHPNGESPIRGKRIFFLGSSVTLGYASLNQSMADYLMVRDGITAVKEAVNGTTLVDCDKTSYVSRLKKHDSSEEFDCVVCQLSTNDANKNMPVGRVVPEKGIAAFDTNTVAGALEYIIAYSKVMWGCPFVLYTGTRFDNEIYQQMVDLIPALVEKWGITVVDLWNDPEMDPAKCEKYDVYMRDPIHPTQAGYQLWWLPKFEEKLFALLGEK